MMLCKELARRDWRITVVKCVNELRGGPVEFTCGILDLHGGHGDAIGAIASMRSVVWVALVEAGQIVSTSVRALLCEYCFDYITLPASHQRIADTIGHAYGMECLFELNRGHPDLAEHGIVGASNTMLRLLDTVQRLARTDAPVCVYGETGTGKELTAIAIHRCSERRDGPFVPVNCAAIPPSLLQSELFGYERGAFTGANVRKIGYIEAAHGGTLLLDEIGDLPHESQASLLRFLQEQMIYRLGSNDPVPVDVRIVSATHIDLRDAMKKGRFRADLFYRLCVIRVDQPPLRSRGQDIELLALHMFERFRGDARHRVRGFSTDAIAAMHEYNWPGNVRELMNRVRRSVATTERRLISASDLELYDRLDVATPSIIGIRKLVERDAIERALLRTRWRVTAAARELGVSRATFYRWMQTYRITRPNVPVTLRT
jgi:DNA-binding NtrC family response regulator